MKPYYEADGITIYHGDCREVLPTLTFDVVVTDPPYGVNLGSHGGAADGRRDHVLVKGSYENYEDTHANYVSLIVPALSVAIAQAQRSLVFCAGSNVWDMPRADAIGGIYLPAAQGRYKWGFSSMSHCLLYGQAPNLHLGAKSTAMQSTAAAEKNGHPCPKPLPWMLWAVSLASTPEDIVLDPFMGSGTTLRAAKDLGRKAIGIEIEERYCEIAAKRLSQGVLPLQSTKAGNEWTDADSAAEQTLIDLGVPDPNITKGESGSLKGVGVVPVPGPSEKV